MKQSRYWPMFLLLSLLAFSLQSCLGIGGSSNGTSGGNFKNTNTGSNGQQIGINTNVLFKGKIYFTQGRNIFSLDGTRTLHQLTKGVDARDPSVSPDKKWILFDTRYKNYSDLVYIASQGGPIHTIRTGNGKFYKDPIDPTIIKNTYFWYQQPIWSPDGNSILFLSDLQKNFDWYFLGGFFKSAPFLDLQVFSLPFNSDTTVTAQPIAYASYGDGGDRDESFRPGHPNQLIYTHYGYDSSGSQQVIQLFLTDTTAIANHPHLYSPVNDAGIALTPPNVENIEPAISPDGNSVAYIRREGDGQMGLYVMPLPKQDVTTTPNDPATMKTAMAPYNLSSPIMKQQFLSQPFWSPDGKQIAYLTYTNNEFDIWLANIALNPKTGVYSMQGSPSQLTSGGVDGDSRPFWTS